MFSGARVDNVHEGVHERTIAPAFRGLVRQDVERLFLGTRVVIRALGGQRVVDVDDADDLREQGNGRVAEAVRVSAAIEPLVMMAARSAARC